MPDKRRITDKGNLMGIKYYSQFHIFLKIGNILVFYFQMMGFNFTFQSHNLIELCRGVSFLCIENIHSSSTDGSDDPNSLISSCLNIKNRLFLFRGLETKHK